MDLCGKQLATTERRECAYHGSGDDEKNRVAKGDCQGANAETQHHEGEDEIEACQREFSPAERSTRPKWLGFGHLQGLELLIMT